MRNVMFSGSPRQWNIEGEYTAVVRTIRNNNFWHPIPLMRLIYTSGERNGTQTLRYNEAAV